MYTQVTFGLFLERLFAKAKTDDGIEFHEYPNIAISWEDGDWLYQIVGAFCVRISRWPSHREREVLINGPDWDNLEETRQEFEARFEIDLLQALADLK